MFFKAGCLVFQKVSCIVFPGAANLQLGVPPYFTPIYCIANQLLHVSTITLNVFFYQLIYKMPLSSYPITFYLQIGTCHLPLQGLNYEPLQLPPFNTPCKEFRVEIRNEALCALGNTGRAGLQIVRYFQRKI